MYVSKTREVGLNGQKNSLNKGLGFLTVLVSALSLVLIMGACASMQTPTGGPKDTKAPRVLSENPKNLSTKFNAKKIEIVFDEFIKLNSAYTEITISPALENPLEAKAKKNLLEVEIDQGLEPNTTYTINFGKAIGDVNENNILKNFSYVFSTGTILDSLSVSGTVKDAVTNERLKETVVFVFPAEQDTLLGKKKPSIYTQTDSAGNFVLKNLRSANYKVYAMREGSADRIYNRGVDEIGFIDTPINLNKNISGLSFRVFKEEPAKLKILDKKVDADGRIQLVLNKGIAKPEIKELESDKFLKGAVTEFSLAGDTTSIWTTSIDFDSLKVGVYSGESLIDKTTIYRNKRENLNRIPTIKDNIGNGKLKPGSKFSFKVSMPVLQLDTSKIVLLADSQMVSGWTFTKTAKTNREFQLSYPFKNDRTYELKFAEGAFTGISGLKTKAYSKTFELDKLENYGNLALTIDLADTSKQYVVQLISEQKNIVREDVIKTNGKLVYTTYPTGKYTLRFVLDENRNGKWDTGNLENKTQPEKIWIYEKTITLRANWDLEEKITVPKDL
jgi:hypothetical protein